MNFYEVKRTCQLCGNEFTTVRADAKFCSKQHRMKAHRLTKTHIRIAAFSTDELEKFTSLFFDCKYLEYHFEHCRNEKLFKYTMFYVSKDDFKRVFRISENETLPVTKVLDYGVVYAQIDKYLE